MGIDLTNLAFIAGALSVGIGFGLQDVIKNLVSGIIILLERPFRVGDWVIMNGEEGKIKQINIRSTEMETFKRTSVIIPNATLLSSSVTNLTHGDNMARQSIKVGVAYNSDPEKVKQVLLDCVKECKDILRYPEPYVLFQDFGASSLDFELRYYIRDLWASWTKPSDLRYLIFKRFAENNIEIPFTQMVIYNGDKANEEREKLNKIN
ncbi:MAG: mechanosensitive ion channel [Alphaproteobacteria bacterium]|nr:mechanosensitive ion channel [Alphaproteobacteria bacterium]